MPAEQAKKQLRRELRRRRQALTPQQRKSASMATCEHLCQLPQFKYGKRIAAYLPNDSELDPQPLLEQAWRLKKQIFLPVLHPFAAGLLLFVEYLPHQTLAKNQFGIPEPLNAWSNLRPIWTLDLVLTPLVGFDANGNRMGMGGGYYDRTFEFLKKNIKPRKPTMIGLAYDCQKVANLPCESWDIPMHSIATESGLIGVKNL